MIERTFDYRRVNRFAGWPVPITSKNFYLMENDGKEDVGLWSFEKHEDGVMIHADMGLECRGWKAINSAIAAFKWIFRNTKFSTIYAHIPKENSAACLVAGISGMKLIEKNETFKCYQFYRG